MLSFHSRRADRPDRRTGPSRPLGSNGPRANFFANFLMRICYHYRLHLNTPSLLGFGFLLGLKHGVDPDHLAAIDGMARLRHSRWNGVWFATGHSFVVTLLAVGIGHIDMGPLDRLAPYLLIAIGGANLVRLFRSQPQRLGTPPRLLTASPLILGILFAAGFETASQISAVVLASKTNPCLLGLAFGGGMVIVDGIGGYNASGVQSYSTRQSPRGLQASRVLNVVVVITSFTLAAAALTGHSPDAAAFPMGILLFGFIFALRVWSRRRGHPVLPKATQQTEWRAGCPDNSLRARSTQVVPEFGRRSGKVSFRFEVGDSNDASD